MHELLEEDLMKPSKQVQLAFMLGCEAQLTGNKFLPHDEFNEITQLPVMGKKIQGFLVTMKLTN